MGELAAQSSRQLGPTEGGLAYATVVAGVANPQQPMGQFPPKLLPHLRQPQGTCLSETCGMPDGTTTYAQVAFNRAALRL